MFQTNLVNTLLKGLDPIRQKTVTLTPGQIFAGKINKLYPGQLASLQLGGLQVTAKLEASLVAGSRYWFQVQPGEGVPILKVLEGRDSTQNNKSTEALLRQMGIQQSKAIESILQFFSKQEIPFSKNQLIQGADTLKNTGMVNEQGLTILKQMVERNIPISPTSFMAINSTLQNSQSFTAEMQQLLNQLEKINSPNSLLALRQSLTAILAESNIKIDGHQTLDLLKTFLTEQKNMAKSVEAQTSLQRMNLIDKESSPKILLAQFIAGVEKATNEELKVLWPTLSKDELLNQLRQGDLNKVFLSIVLGKGEKGTESVRQLFALINTENASMQTIQGEPSTAKQLVSIMNKIGYQYERDIIQFLKTPQEDSQKLITQLKSLLLQAQQEHLPEQIKGKVDLILHRIIGQQLLSANHDSPISHHAVMIPLKLMGMETDLTIQWEGKKQKNGELDPDHCRILFYVHLANLNETVVDVQIQNRIVSIQIINEQEKPVKLIQSFQPLLRNALLELNYQLSSVKWNQSGTEKIKKNSSASNPYQSHISYQGVDIRV